MSERCYADDLRQDIMGMSFVSDTGKTMLKEPLDFYDLDAFLSSDRSPENCMQLADLDGFLTAVAVSPEPIPMEEWWPMIWGGEDPQFRNAKEAKQITGSIRTRYDEIVSGLDRDPPLVTPVFWMEDGEPIASDWAEGFLDGIKLRLAEWSRLIASDDNTILIPLAIFWLDDDEQPIIHVDDDVREQIEADGPELIPETVVAIHRYWRSHSECSRPLTRLH